MAYIPSSGSILSFITNGTQIADTLAGDSGQNSLVITGARKEVSFTTNTAQAVGTTDVSNYRYVGVQITSQGSSSTVTFQGSNDNSTWVSIALMISTSVGNVQPVTSTTSTALYHGPLPFRYFRLNVTGISAGTTAGVIELFGEPPANMIGSFLAQQSGAWTVALNSGSIFAMQGSGTNISSVVSANPSSLLTGASIFGQLPGGTAVLGSVTALQGTNPWIETFSNSSIISFQLAGSVLATSTTVNTGNSSVMLLNSANVIGSVAALQGTNPWVANVGASVAAVIIGGSVATATTNSSVMLLNSSAVIGSVATLQGTNPWIINGSVSGTVGASILGAALANQGEGGSAFIQLVTAAYGRNWNGANWDRTQGNSSIGTLVSTGSSSVITVSPMSSIVGTYAEDSASTDTDKGIFVLGVRNDTMASLVSADKDYGAFATDSGGRSITKPFISEDGTVIRFTGSTVSTSVLLIQASAIGKKNYITDFWISNTGATTTLITFKDGSTSILGYTIAPAGGGSNSQGIHVPIVSARSQDLTVVPNSASSVIYYTINGYQAP